MWKPWRSAHQGSGAATATVLLQRAVRALIDDDDPAAEEALTEWVKKDSRLTEPYRALGRLYRKRGEVGRAIRLHQNLLLRKDLGAKERAAALAELAEDFDVGGYRKRAIACHEELLAGDGRREASLAALVKLRLQESDYKGAREMHRRLEKVRKERDPEGEVRILVAEAEGCRHAGENDRARKLLKKALRRRPSEAEASLLLGDLEAERGRERAAVAAWTAVAERGGEHSNTAWRRLAALGRGLSRGGLERLLRARLVADPRDREARQHLATALAADGEVESALEQWRTLLAQDPDDRAARVGLGKLLLAEERSAEALEEFAQWIAMLEKADEVEGSR